MKFFVVILCVLAPLHAKDKLTADEIVQKHLASIGTVEDRVAIHDRIMQGQVITDHPGSGGPSAQGAYRLFSQGQQFHISLLFNYPYYYGEDFASDTNKPSVVISRPLFPAVLGDFFATYDGILTEGLVGGSLTTAWALLDVPGRHARLDYEGLKKVGGRELHVISYRMKKAQGDLTIQLGFDPETFRHVRTFYSGAPPLTTTTMPATGKGSPVGKTGFARADLEETYSEFRTLHGVTVPGHWTIRYSRADSMQRWEVSIAMIGHNQPIAPQDFTISQPR